ncbi:hypothetical protein JCGZ_00816 [Jatropha curcas]|uniref:Uncharacterized protein n=1 Tax=Jatropha curcas TaxID=180498 RepID=A0A067L4P3_JATCU|nr:2S albumin [Jatropha curcas]KDP39059.1 hypothetical protein JCGZ_00816 [Jatropha curcas]
MAKLMTSTALICILLVIITNAFSGYITAATISLEKEEDAYEVREICKWEARRKDLSSCESYVRQSRTRSEETSAKQRIGNRHHVPTQCCDQAWKLHPVCQCEAIMYLAQKQGHIGSQEYDEAERRAFNIIDVCFGSVCPR